MLDEVLKKELIGLLGSLEPEKVILFGSYAWGTPSKDSDIDLYIVTRDDYVPASYRQKAKLNASFAEAIRDIRKRVPIDMIIHTRPMHRKFIELGSMFSRELMENGVVIYEKDNQRLA